MSQALRAQPRKADGSPLTMNDLPKLTDRWTSGRKATVMLAIKTGLLTVEDASAKYCLTTDELAHWNTTYDRHGQPGLRITRLKDYRPR